ncbi:hypothetical protein BV20DRAFT_276870 [Pilatotrama ljubarskyi]|nr:hypothetical protein BV20DRAFT_276870 [Pilatotrama ljubarskyi]
MSSTVASYPRTRSQTKSLPALKRKSSEQSSPKASRPPKIARKDSSDSVMSSVHLSPEALAGPPEAGPSASLGPGGRTAWPADVPRSMLFTFRLGEPAFHMYDGPKRSSTPDVPVSSDSPQFLATGPEPMFDHSWRVAFMGEAHTTGRRNASSKSAEGHRRDAAKVMNSHSTPASAPQPPTIPSSAPKPSPTGPTLRSLRRGAEAGDENIYPVVEPGRDLPERDSSQLVKGVATPRDNPAPLSPSSSLSSNRQIDPQVRLPPVPSRSSSFPGVNLGLTTLPRAAARHEQQLPIYAPVPSSRPSLLLTGLSSGLGDCGDPSALRPFQTPAQDVDPSHLSRSDVYAPAIHRMTLSSQQPLPAAPSVVSLVPVASRCEPPFQSLLLPPHPGLYPVYHSPVHPYSGPTHPPHLLSAHDEHAAAHSQGGSSFSAILGQHPYPPQVELVAVPPSYEYAYASHRPVLPPSNTHASLPPVPQSAGLEAPWASFYESIKKSRSKGTKKKKQSSRGVDDDCEVKVPEAGIDDDVLEVDADGSRKRAPWQSLKCPLCPRTFSLPNGLAIHLKWHWGASGLEWKRGISRTGKTIERALRDAERRREEAAQRQIEADFPGIPPSLRTQDASAHAGSDMHQASFRPPSSDEGYPFTMPIIAHSTFNAFEFPFFSSESSATSDSPYTSPVDPQHPYTFPPPVVAASSTTSSVFSGSGAHTPELLGNAGSTNGAGMGHTSSGWSANLFGYGGVENANADADAEGEDDDDLFGDCQLRSTPDGRTVDEGTASAVRFSLSSGDGPFAFSDAFPSRHLHPPVSTAFSGVQRPRLVRAPRLGTLRLPASDEDEDEDEDEDDEGYEGLFPRFDHDGAGDRGEGDASMTRGSISDGLAPLFGLPSLQALPELDAAFESLSVF